MMTIATGFNILVVKLSMFGRIKMAGASPYCPQDFSDDRFNDV